MATEDSKVWNIKCEFDAVTQSAGKLMRFLFLRRRNECVRGRDVISASLELHCSCPDLLATEWSNLLLKHSCPAAVAVPTSISNNNLDRWNIKKQYFYIKKKHPLPAAVHTHFPEERGFCMCLLCEFWLRPASPDAGTPGVNPGGWGYIPVPMFRLEGWYVELLYWRDGL